MPLAWIHALGGGILIGIAVSLMLLCNGRVTGISGIINSSLTLPRGDTAWRLSFIAGLLAGGALLRLFYPAALGGQLDTAYWTVGAAGLLVGWGTVMGSGCTSGHGVCGISRMSPRSVVATLLFIVAGMATVAAMRSLGVVH